MSAQLDLLTVVPPQGTQCYELLMAMKKGVRLTIWNAMKDYGVGALSQRIGDLKKKYGWPVQSHIIETHGGAHVAEYWLP